MTALRSKPLRILLIVCVLTALCAGAACESAATPTDLQPVQIVPGVAGGEQDRDGVWHLTHNEEGVLSFRWNDAGAESYGLLLRGPDGLAMEKTAAAPAWDIPQKDLPGGDYTLEISALRGGKTVASARLLLKLELPAEETEPPAEEPEPPAEEPEPPAEEAETPAEEAGAPAEEAEGPAEEEEAPAETPEASAGEPAEEPAGEPETPDIPPSVRPGRPRNSGKGKTGSGNTGVRITPGKALTSTHAKGSGTMRTYGAVAPEAAEGDMDILILGGEELELSCGESMFTAGFEEDELILVTRGGDDWTLTMDVLKTLRLSGIRRLRLISPEAETVLDTDMELTGTGYGSERARGFVSADFLLFRREGEWGFRVEDRDYPMETAERKERQ